MCIGMRLHTLIYAAINSVPLIGLVYDPKINSFMEYTHQRQMCIRDRGVLDMLVKTGLLPSKGEARRLVQQNGLSINDVKYNDVNGVVTEDMITDEGMICLLYTSGLKKITAKKLMKQPIVLREYLKYYLHPILLRTRIKNVFLLGLDIIQGDGYI